MQRLQAQAGSLTGAHLLAGMARIAMAAGDGHTKSGLRATRAGAAPGAGAVQVVRRVSSSLLITPTFLHALRWAAADRQLQLRLRTPADGRADAQPRVGGPPPTLTLSAESPRPGCQRSQAGAAGRSTLRRPVPDRFRHGRLATLAGRVVGGGLTDGLAVGTVGMGIGGAAAPAAAHPGPLGRGTGADPAGVPRGADPADHRGLTVRFPLSLGVHRAGRGPVDLMGRLGRQCPGSTPDFI